MNAADKRHTPRLNRRFILRVAPDGDEPKRWSFVTIHNLSVNGVFFTYDRPVREGMLLHMKIDFPDQVIECVGRIVRIGGVRHVAFHDVAARIENLHPAAKKYIETFVSHNSG